MTDYIGGLIAKGITTVSTNSTQLQIWGLGHFRFSGMSTTVSVTVLGVDCGDFTVAAGGSVTIALTGGAAVSGNAGVVSLAALVAADALYSIEQSTPAQVVVAGVTTNINIPIVIGHPYVAQGQRLRPATADDGKSLQGPLLGKRRRSAQFAALVQDAVVVSFGTLLTPTPSGNMISSTMLDGGATGSALAQGVGYTGVFRQTLVDDSTFDGALCWQVDRPYPFVICAINQFVVASEN